MRTLTCEGCGQTHPAKDMFSVLGKTLCEPCGDKALAARGSQPVPEGAICRHADPTVCGQCGMDNGDAELATVVAGVPVCGPCAYTLRHRPFPLWVKLAFLTFLVLAVVDFGINWRLFQAYFEIPGSRRAFEEGKIERAAELMDRAASHVPEYRELRDEATFMKGIVLIREEKFDDAAELMSGLRYSSLSRETKEAAEFYELVAHAQGLIGRKQADQAIPLVLAFKKRHPDFKAADDLLREAETSAAFDSKDYDTFLAKAREGEKAHPGQARLTAQVASALACKYAATGDEQFRKESLEKLEEARKAAKDAEGFKEYEARIMHRLQTREIIDREEYDRKFREGSDGRKGKAQ